RARGEGGRGASGPGLCLAAFQIRRRETSRNSRMVPDLQRTPLGAVVQGASLRTEPSVSADGSAADLSGSLKYLWRSPSGLRGGRLAGLACATEGYRRRTVKTAHANTRRSAATSAHAGPGNIRRPA